MSYIIKPSLEHSALIKIVIALWNRRDITSLIANSYVPKRDPKKQKNGWYSTLRNQKKEWQVVEDQVSQNVTQLPLPQSLKRKVLVLIKPIGLQILQWMEYHEICELGVILPNNLCWKQQGTVDRKRTAEVLMKDDSLDVSIRYQLACINCLKDDILELWNKLPENWFKSFCSEENFNIGRTQELVVHWTCDIIGEISWMENGLSRLDYRMCSSYQFAFEKAALGGNKAGTEYFLYMLTDKEKEESLVSTARRLAEKPFDSIGYYSDYPENHKAEVLCFLLAQMDEENQLKVFQSCAYDVLKCLIKWPWQILFLETANRMWEFISNECYFLLLQTIVYKQHKKCGDYYKQKLFGEFWRESPMTHRGYVVQQCEKSAILLTLLFVVEDKENIRRILEDADVKQKERIIFCERGMLLCESLMYKYKKDLLTFFVQESLTSMQIRVEFFEKLKKHILSYHSNITLEDNLNGFLHFLDDLIHNDDKKRS